MTRRAPPGPQLAAGRLRVDAARAIAKLREYQLAVRAAWVLEAIRAAVAAGATRISLTGDTNDLWLSWDGEPWPVASLPRLFDELVSPEASDAGHHVRLLAAAVNSALGMSPAYVDVFAVAATGRAMRARYTPDVLDEPEGDLADAPLRKITVEQAAPPPGAGTGMAIHLRRRFGVAVLSHLVRELPEIELARASCADLGVSLYVRGTLYGYGAAVRDVVRVPLGDGLGGFVAIVDPDDAGPHPMLEVAEHGVVLAKNMVDLGFPSRGRMPLRVFVDAPRMPTNASRSEVRQDVHPISTALRRAQALLPALADRLAAELEGGPRAERARAAALLLLAAVGKEGAPLLGLGRLLELPLVRNAVGAPRPPSGVWLGLVHTGGSPFPEELAPWLGHVLWIPPGDPSVCLIDPAAVDTAALKRLVRRARRERRAQRRFYGHAPRRPVVEARELPRMRARLGATVAGSLVEPQGFEGLAGEVCIRPGGEGGELVLLLEGRELEHITFGSPIPFTAVIDAPRLVPADHYRSATRDAEYARALAAMRAGVLCAIEAIAAGDTADMGDAADTADAARAGFVPGEAAPDLDRRLIQGGLALAQELAQGGTGVRAAGPLFEAPLWRLCGSGDWASTAELRRHAVVGVTAPGAQIRALPRRPIVEVELRYQALLAHVLPNATRLVTYDADCVEPEPLYSIDLAQGLVQETDLALALRGEGCAAAIAPSSAPRLVISHLGRRVEERAYDPVLVPCTIHVDSDDVVPDAHWLRALDDGDIARQLAGWERELLRAAAAALAGTRVPDLLGHAPIDAGGPLGRALWAALATRDPEELLGEAIAAQLRGRPLWRVLGERELVSAQDLAARAPREILYLATDVAAEPIEGFAPILADAVRAHALGQLAGRAVRDAAPELAEHRRRVERAARLAALRARPELPHELSGGGICIRRETPHLRAVIGVGSGAGMEIEIRAEGRALATRALPAELPVAAIVDVPLESLDEELRALKPAAEGAIVRGLRGAIPELLAAIAREQPAALADLGPVRTLLATALAVLYFNPPARSALLAAEAFPTLQGPRASLAKAVHGAVIATARWDGEWLGPDAGEAPTELDRPVLHVEDDELGRVIARIHRHGIVDLTEAVDKLQAERRMARGLLPVPAVQGVAPELKRKLDELGVPRTGARTGAGSGPGPAPGLFGRGEIGLVDEPSSLALLHVHGTLRGHVTLDVLPPVRLAIEAPELVADRGRVTAALKAQVQALALQLVRAVLAQVPVLPVWLRRRLRHTLLAGQGTAELEGVPLFETADGAWIHRAAVAQQAALFGDVWCIPRAVPDPRPLDERRVVLMLGLGEQAAAQRAGIPCKEATYELALDAKARANLARPRSAAIRIEASIATLAMVTLDGDGRTAPRGVVAVLAGPFAALHRGIYAHRELYPFDPAIDECLWPTRAIVDDARLTPDRTWSLPVRDAAWEALAATIRNASEAALRELVRPPPRALASQVIGFSSHAELPSLRGDPATQLRGALWIDGAPGELCRIDVVHNQCPVAYTPPRGVALRGTLHVSASFHEPQIQGALGELCEAVHGRMLRKLAARPSPPDLAVAHIAHGIAHGHLKPSDARGLALGCFRPRPIDAREWETLCWSLQRVPLVAPDAAADELSVVDDGSATARVVLGVLGDRVGRDQPAPLPAARPERVSTILRDAPPVRHAHPLDPLLAAVGVRLQELGLALPRFRILDDATSPLAVYEGGLVGIAGAHARLRAIAAALLAKAAWSEAAVDALTAHVVTILNVALTSVTDATEAHALAGLLRRA